MKILATNSTTHFKSKEAQNEFKSKTRPDSKNPTKTGQTTKYLGGFIRITSFSNSSSTVREGDQQFILKGYAYKGVEFVAFYVKNSLVYAGIERGNG